MLKRLRLKFVCINMVIVTVMLSIVFGLVFHFTRENWEEESLQMMQTIASNPLSGQTVGSQDQVQLPYFVVQINQWGDILAIGGGYYDLSDQEFLSQILQEALASGQQTGVLAEYRLRYYRTATFNGIQLVFADTSSEEATLTNLIQTCVLTGILGLAAFLLISMLLARWAIKPVEQAWEQQKQFVADASHELKTPLTVILTNAELLQCEEYSQEDHRQFSSHILLMAQQMRTLVERLLDLARVDNGSLSSDAFAPLDLSQFVSDGLLPFEALFFEQELTLESQIQPGIQIKASHSHLNQVLDILLDNARKYSVPGGTVWVTLRAQGSHAVLSVASPGTAISPEDLTKIFKRFYRVDKARSRDGSYGLGLSIAESIINAHHGKIWAESANGYNVFRIQLPMQ